MSICVAKSIFANSWLFLVALSGSTWTLTYGLPNTPTLQPTCGQVAVHQTPLILNGKTVQVADFPWHANLYSLQNSTSGSQKNFICGATIIKANLLVTAAHCVFDETLSTATDSQKLFVLAGNMVRDYDWPGHDDTVVKRGEVETIYVQPQYFGIKGNYASDIALLKLKTPFELSSILQPACLDFTDQISIQSLEPGSHGKVAGFGNTATGDSSPVLQSKNVAYVSNAECLNSTKGKGNDIAIFLSVDKFCGGFGNGSALCNGDSGAGFVSEQNDRWYLLGVTSVGLGVDVINGEIGCDPYAYNLFTNIRLYSTWIADIFTRS